MTQENTTEDADREAQESGFNAEMNGEAPPAMAEPTAQTHEEPVEQVVEEAVIAGYKESELKALLERVKEMDDVKDGVRKAHGQVGGLKNYFEDQIKKLSTQSAPGGLRVNQEALARLVEQYPDLGFDKLFEKPEAQTAPAEQVATQSTHQAPNVDVARVKFDAAVEALDEAHPDRLKIIQTAEYANWLKTMKEDERIKFLSSQSPVYVSRKLDEFKDWNVKRQAKGLANEKRLAGAVTPRGTPRAAPAVISDEAAAQAAFDAVFT